MNIKIYVMNVINNKKYLLIKIFVYNVIINN